MKQHINKEQFKGINILDLIKITKDAQVETIIKNIQYFHESNKQNHPYKYTSECEYLWDRLAEKFTIGKMIEILDNDKQLCYIERSSDGYWCVETHKSFGESKNELADALWDIIKLILNETK